MVIEFSQTSTAVWGGIASLIAVVGVVWNIAKAQDKAHAGFIDRESCHKHVDEMKKEVHGIHSRIDETNTKIDDLSGYVRGVMNHKKD
jgi:hypothetical protein